MVYEKISLETSALEDTSGLIEFYPVSISKCQSVDGN